MTEKAQEKLRKEINEQDQRKGQASENQPRPNRNLIIHGMVEDRSVEDLKKVQDVAYDIGLSLHRWDINKTTRLGAYEKRKKEAS